MELLIIRHAPSVPPGHLYGRTDVAAEVSDAAWLAALRQSIGRVDQWIASPAGRCRMTLDALKGVPVAALDRTGAPATFDARMWEQDFGAWEGLSYADVPDIGVLDAAALVDHRPPFGESFRDVCQRVQPALRDVIADAQGGRVAVVAHAGVVRAALALALGAPELALSFDVKPLSLTKFRILAPEVMSIICTNWCPECA